MPVLNLNLGDGMGIDQTNKVGVKYAGQYIHTVTEGTSSERGLYVEPLVGTDGSVPDNWTTKAGVGRCFSSSVTPVQIDNFIDIDRDTVTLIFTYGAYQITGRSNVAITYDNSQIKNLGHLRDEMNFPMQQNPSNGPYYKPKKGELIQLVTNPCVGTVRKDGSTFYAAENGNRTNDVNQELKVLLLINEILYQSDEEPTGNQNWVVKLKVTCLYSSVSAYEVGNQYSVGYNT